MKLILVFFQMEYVTKLFKKPKNILSFGQGSISLIFAKTKN